MRAFVRWCQLIAAISFFGSMMQTGCASKVIHNVNPCGTILICDPVEYDLVTNYGQWPDYNVDPTCTIPGFCGGTPFPPTFGGGAPAATSDQGTGNGSIIPGANGAAGAGTGQ